MRNFDDDAKEGKRRGVHGIRRKVERGSKAVAEGRGNVLRGIRASDGKD